MVMEAGLNVSAMKGNKSSKGVKLKRKLTRKRTDNEEKPHTTSKKPKKQNVQTQLEKMPNVNEEGMTPEEARVLERKMKKILKKEEKRKMREEGMSEDKKEDQSKAAERALEYLECWSMRRSEWRFKKIRQTWLLQHMYEPEKVPDTSFSILLPYLENLRGASRDLTTQKAETIIKEETGHISQSEDEKKRIQRALEVARLLAID